MKDCPRPVAAFIALHARRRPDHPALCCNGVSIPYLTLHRDLTAMTLALAEFGLAPGEVAAVTHHDLYFHLLLVFGFASLGVMTGSFRGDEGAECHPLLAKADLVLAPHRIAQPACKRIFTITDDWVAAVLASPALVGLPPVQAQPETPLVVLRSSGTTGQPKRMMLTHGMMAVRLRTQRAPGRLGLNRHARFLAIMHFSVGSMLMAASNCFMLGATFMFYNRREPAEILLACKPSHVTLLPYQLRSLLAKLPSGGGGDAGPALPDLTVQTIGAKLPPELRRLVLKKLAGRVTENYGTNEVGAIGAVDEQGTITLGSGNEAEVVDAADRLLPAGSTGLLRVRGPGMVRGYVDDADATATMFRNGWFYPGDIALALGSGRLNLVGRRADVLNLGGAKVACADVESKIIARTLLRDVAVLQRNDGSASPPMIVCVVLGKDSDLTALVKILEPLLAFPFAVRVVAEIPRTPEGKIKRAALLQALPKEVASQQLSVAI